MKKSPLLILSGICLITAAVLKFALIGYSTLSLCFLALAALLAFYQLAAVKKLKKLRIAVTVLLILGIAAFAVFEAPVISASRGDSDPQADYLIVLGAGVNGSTPSLSMVNRLTAAKAYLEKYPASIAILSGGQGPGENMTEAQAMYDWLTGQGIDGDRLILEERSSSTEENLSFSFEIIDSLGNSTASAAVCSSEYHLCRAKFLAAQMGREVLTVPARTSLFVLRMNYFIREGFAMAYYRVFG